MTRRPAAALSVLLAGCAADRSPALMDAYGDCVMATVIRMDDGKTDPVSLAYGIAPQCAVQYGQLTDAQVGQMLTENSQNAQRRLMRDQELRLITSAILIHRSKNLR